MSVMTSVNLTLVTSDSPTPSDDQRRAKSNDALWTSASASRSLLFRGMICFQVLAYGSYSVLVHLCERNGRITFSSSTMNLMIELIKLSVSLNAFVCAKQSLVSTVSVRTCLTKSVPYSVPAILYFINNNLAVHMQLQMDPASYQILSNFKIFTTAVLYRLIIKQKLSRRQWLALTFLLLGGLVYSVGTLKNASFVSKTMADSRLIIREMYIRPLGIPLIAIYCTLSGLAGVYNEWILKRNYHESLHLQNVFLYAYGTLFNSIPTMSVLIESLSSDKPHIGLFDGFSSYTWVIIISQAVNGLFMSVVIKHSSNIIRLFVISFSLIVTTVLSFLIYHIHFNLYFFASFVTMTCALSLYYTN